MLDKQIIEDLGPVSRGIIFPALLLSILALLFLFLITFVSVVFRYLGWLSWIIDEEYYFLAIAVLVGSGLTACSALNAHIIIDFATDNLPQAIKDFLDIIGCFIMGVAQSYMGYQLMLSGIERHLAYDVTGSLFWSVFILIGPFAGLLLVSGVYTLFISAVSSYRWYCSQRFGKRHASLDRYVFWDS